MDNCNNVFPITVNSADLPINVTSDTETSVNISEHDVKIVPISVESEEKAVNIMVNNTGLVKINLDEPSKTDNDYNKLINKPSINGVTLVGNKSFDDLSLKIISNSTLSRILV